MFEARRHKMLVEETLQTCMQYLTTTDREESKDPMAKNYHFLVLRVKL